MIPFSHKCVWLANPHGISSSYLDFTNGIENRTEIILPQSRPQVDESGQRLLTMFALALESFHVVAFLPGVSSVVQDIAIAVVEGTDW